MAAERDQQIRTGLQGFGDVDTGQGAGRALEVVAVFRHHHRRAMELIHQPGGCDADDALVKRWGADDDTRTGTRTIARNESLRLALHLGTLGPPLIVFRLQALGQRHGPFAIFGEQEVDRQGALGHASRRIDAGPYPKGHGVGADRFRPSKREQGLHPGTAIRPIEHLQAEMRDDPVFPQQGDHVRDGTDGHQVQTVFDIGLGPLRVPPARFPQPLAQRHDQFEGHTAS